MCFFRFRERSDFTSTRPEYRRQGLGFSKLTVTRQGFHQSTAICHARISALAEELTLLPPGDGCVVNVEGKVLIATLARQLYAGPEVRPDA